LLDLADAKLFLKINQKLQDNITDMLPLHQLTSLDISPDFANFTKLEQLQLSNCHLGDPELLFVL
jgi:hypothetical protein